LRERNIRGGVNVIMDCAWPQFKNEWCSVSTRHNASKHMKEAHW